MTRARKITQLVQEAFDIVHSPANIARSATSAVGAFAQGKGVKGAKRAAVDTHRHLTARQSPNLAFAH